jgi:hypothetical protein
LSDATQLMPGEPMHRDRAVPLRSSPSSRHLELGLGSQPQPAPSICREQACSPACVERLRCVVAPVEIAVRQIAPTDAARSAYSEYSQVGAAVPRTRSTHRWARRFRVLGVLTGGRGGSAYSEYSQVGAAVSRTLGSGMMASWSTLLWSSTASAIHTECWWGDVRRT